MAAPLDCPGLEDWRALVAADLPPDQQERCQRHLESCPTCQAHLDRTEGGGDDLLRLARRVGDPTLAPADPSLVQVLEWLCEGTGRAAPAEPVDLPFLRPADKPGVLGTLGAYEVQGVIGQGGMGVVLKAFDPALHRLVAIKVLAPALAGSTTARRRFKREAQAAAAVCHDHVVPVHGVHEVDGLPYLVMQYVAGESLQQRLDRAGPLPVEEVVRIGLQAAAGLAAAHAQGLIHRDVKPANLLLEDGLARVKITDFGLARMAEDVPLTRAGVVAGTPEYMAPEQARGEQVDPRADLFSLGSVLYACCTGRPPFRGATPVAVLRRVTDESPPPVRSLNPEVPAWLEALINRLLAKDPAQRFPSAAEVAALLEAYLAHLRQPTTIAAPELPSSPAAGRLALAPGLRAGIVKRFPQLLLVSAPVLLAALGVVFWFAAGAGGTGRTREYAREYYQSFRGNPENGPGPDFFGPDADQCVKFEPAGLRITLPAGYAGERPDTGVTVGIAVPGDFEITVGFEILQEPEPPDANKHQTRLTLNAIPDSPEGDIATLSRQGGVGGGTRFLTWMRRWDEAGGKSQIKADAIPTEAKSGRLRLVRSGSALSYYASEDPNGPFRLLARYPFTDKDLKDVSITASTGDPEAALDVRVTDLHIRADSLPSLPGPGGAEPAKGPGLPEATPPKAGSRGWLTAVVIAGLILALSVVLGGWLAVRRRRLADPRPATARDNSPSGGSTRPPVCFPCPGCGKDLKARAELAGKKVKCPGCARSVLVPSAHPGEPGRTTS
jgi:serine/threonine protein kinase